MATGTLLFGTLLLIFFLISGNFANLAVEGSLRGISADMEESFYLDSEGNVQLDDSEIMLKWGFDALYSNLGYRLIELETDREVVRSISPSTEGALIDVLPLNIPTGYFLHEKSLYGKAIDSFRSQLLIAGKYYHLDVIRSDLLGKLANEAVLPAIVDISIFAIGIAFILFLIVNIVAIRLIVKPVKVLSQQVERIKPEDLTQRIDIKGVPNELVPITDALNEALHRVQSGFDLQKRFVADAAHELRTPLTILLSRLQLSLVDSQVKKDLICDTKYMSRIVEQLLDLSRIQMVGERKLEIVDVLVIVKEVISMLAPLVVDNEQNIELLSKVDNCCVNADKGELVVVFKNLIENAVKHTSQGSQILVTVDKGSVVIEDSGNGIPEEIRQQIFERFWRANQSDLSGSGLGLAIVKETLEHFNAEISVSKSETLNGAKFSIHFNSK